MPSVAKCAPPFPASLDPSQHGTLMHLQRQVKISSISNNLVHYIFSPKLSEFGVFVDSYGRRSRTDDIKWSRLPLSFGLLLCHLLKCLPVFSEFHIYLFLMCFFFPCRSLQRTLPVCDLLQLSGCDWNSGPCLTGVNLPFVTNRALIGVNHLLILPYYCLPSATRSFLITWAAHWSFQGHNVVVSHIPFPLQASFLCAPGYSEPTLPWPSHLLGGHLPGLLLPEQTAGHLLQRQFGTKPGRHWRPAAERLRTQVRTQPPHHTAAVSAANLCIKMHSVDILIC